MTEENRPAAVTVGEDVVALYEEVRAAAEAKSRWAKHEKALKAQLLDALGYDPEDTRPASSLALGPDGTPAFEVAVTYRRGLDGEYLKTRYPAVYAECERDTPVKSVRPASSDQHN
ncbi:hypothetical protein ACH4FX_12030 [Streptomyces sp. NPDC018019]|uniref:hypothetical protein n=1 Tax=Streptomyces sp. NPDC018019 TaxID=3365030 RepID=UPI00379366D1